ncbi:MAG: thioredoxin-disulfide reductase [Deltaproteobacteria bacterium]|nr:thioredoxin-disulfide reductase [Deltaproteobacteria bacterium]MBW1922979.1 thioredoxin-disulfide reductase [Deltaproteobacteria bacterium]MBW1949067.1 thioredoxin-disulfide reductase [Deltaproteobacteria bacterium]MBW2009589.1 thioredoxin-disulfide reductase [Deltaproteobacteria bacterium]MBW2101790.1 thioredoxin-disulfide reductase [Deltaproteobacteria bacterium]
MKDLIIIGAGPAGLTAGLYAARARLEAVAFERLAPGGQVLNTDRVENYPGFPEGITGFELIDRMKRQAENFGLLIESREVVELELSPEKKVVVTDQGPEETKALILACGAVPRKLGIEGESLLTGKGVSYCATCDGFFFRDQEVAVIGGGDTAVEEAIFLTRFASKVHLIHRRDRLRAVRLLEERARAEEKISFIWDTVPLKIEGRNGVEGVRLKNVKTGEESLLPVSGVFVFIGYTPTTDLVKGLLELDQGGFVVTDEGMETSVPGVFAAGDIRSKALRQVSTAVGEGAAAAFSAEKYIENLKGR